EGFSLEALQKLLDRFERLSASLKLAPDFTQYLRTLLEDGLEADAGEGPEYDDEEARVAIGTSEKLVMTVAGQLGLAEELRGGGVQAAGARGLVAAGRTGSGRAGHGPRVPRRGRPDAGAAGPHRRAGLEGPGRRADVRRRRGDSQSFNPPNVIGTSRSLAVYL